MKRKLRNLQLNRPENFFNKEDAQLIINDRTRNNFQASKALQKYTLTLSNTFRKYY